MPCEPVQPEIVFECDLCACQFEPDVADADRDGRPRCPQCGSSTAHQVGPQNLGEFVVTRGTRFR